MNVGELIDKIYDKKQEVKELNAQIDFIEKEISFLEDQLKNLMQEQSIFEAAGSKATCSLEKTIYPVVEDWGMLYEWIKQNNLFSFLQKRISLTVYRELVEENMDPPGVVRNQVTKLKIGAR